MEHEAIRLVRKAGEKFTGGSGGGGRNNDAMGSGMGAVFLLSL